MMSTQRPCSLFKLFEYPMLRTSVLAARLAARQLALSSGSRSIARPRMLVSALPSAARLQFLSPASQLATFARRMSSDASTEGVESCVVPSSQASSRIDAVSGRYTFQAETKQLLDIVARSLYADKEVFIREIVSNASDALEKLRLADLQQGAEPSGSALSISVTCDDVNGTLTVTDSGIGMSKEELVQCLGTIASSGTRSLVEKLKTQGEGAARWRAARRPRNSRRRQR